MADYDQKPDSQKDTHHPVQGPDNPQEYNKETEPDTSRVYGVSPVPQRKRKGKVHKRLKWVFLGIIVLVLVVAAAVVLPLTLRKASKDVIIRVPKNATIEMVRDSAEKYLGKDYAESLMASLKIFGFDERDRHGAYLITKDMSAMRAGRRLSRGGQQGIDLVINGVRTKEQLADLIASRLDISSKEMLDALNDSTLLSHYNIDTNKVMVLFINNTYQFYWNATPQEVIRKMHNEYRKFWNNDRQELAEAMRLSRRDVAIIASIVDEETNVPSEKGIVGRLYINRLNQNMPLQADPTLKYAIGDFGRKRILNEDKLVESPYNTYKYKGLPPGPIRTPDPATIDSILHSRSHDYLYMCADSSLNGTHHFAKDYETHLKYARQYHQAADNKNIKR